MPYQSVAQYAMLWSADILRVRSPLTSPRSPSRPWPYIDMRAGLRRRRRRQVARVVRRERPRLALRPAGRVEDEPAAGLAVLREVQRQLEGALDAAADERVRILGHGVDGEDRRGVAEGGEGVVAHGDHAPGQALGAGDGEVPRQLQFAAPHAGRGEIGEDALHRRPAGLELRVGGPLPVAVGGELRRGRDRLRRGRRRGGAARRRCDGRRRSCAPGWIISSGVLARVGDGRRAPPRTDGARRWSRRAARSASRRRASAAHPPARADSTATASSPSICTSTGEPGLQPSPRFWSVGSTCSPVVLAGSDSATSARRRPVAVEQSSTREVVVGPAAACTARRSDRSAPRWRYRCRAPGNRSARRGRRRGSRRRGSGHRGRCRRRRSPTAAPRRARWRPCRAGHRP